MSNSLEPNYPDTTLGSTRFDSELPRMNHLPEMSHKARECVDFFFSFVAIFFMKDSTDRKYT